MERLGFFEYLFTYVMPLLIERIPMTLAVTGTAFVIGNLLAVPVAVARISRNPLLWIPSYCYILVMRGTPLLVQLYLIYYGLKAELPREWVSNSWATPILRNAFWYAALAFSLNVAGYTGEILRGALQAVPYGEIEAGKAFGMNGRQIFWRIKLPRAIRICLPAMVGETILLLKATALCAFIAVSDVMQMANYIRAQELRVYEPLLGAAIIYMTLVFIMTRILNRVERYLNRDRQQPPSSSSGREAAIAGAAGPA
jgi:His/Glu/Gln/Arg/opine family amino acid ABC transporter permease subunit